MTSTASAIKKGTHCISAKRARLRLHAPGGGGERKSDFMPQACLAEAPGSTLLPAPHSRARRAIDPQRAVRLVGDAVFEPSPLAAAEYVTSAGWTAVTLGLPGHWLLASARRGRLLNGENYVFVWLTSLLGAIALGILTLPVAWLLATSRGRRGLR
ncbi:hypothetical protein ABZX90_35885 [Streptomyces sp. NPDC002935]|uniref:hypothetical protein n=1 Tax=unclassified Streptomyces TaxID=2593676 RepID=UPI003327BAB4